MADKRVRISIRLSPLLHRKAAVAAAHNGISLNEWIADAIAAHAAGTHG